jgi:hypothetical protein
VISICTIRPIQRRIKNTNATVFLETFSWLGPILQIAVEGFMPQIAAVKLLSRKIIT